jgi:Putative lumazine-binding
MTLIGAIKKPRASRRKPTAMNTPNAFQHSAPTPQDLNLITQTSQDYIEGWYTANVERMQRCLHPELVKRTIAYDPRSETWLLRPPITAQMMAQFTREGGGSDAPEAERSYELTIQDVFRHIACVKLVSREFMDFIHLAKLGDRWLIVNVLWELREGEHHLEV